MNEDREKIYDLIKSGDIDHKALLESIIINFMDNEDIRLLEDFLTREGYFGDDDDNDD